MGHLWLAEACFLAGEPRPASSLASDFQAESSGLGTDSLKAKPWVLLTIRATPGPHSPLPAGLLFCFFPFNFQDHPPEMDALPERTGPGILTAGGESQNTLGRMSEVTVFPQAQQSRPLCLLQFSRPRTAGPASVLPSVSSLLAGRDGAC